MQPIRQSGTGNHRPSAFTLVELLVVIAIIGVLVALLLPAVQAAREAARRMQCQNNLKQIGLAVLNYAENAKILPPGGFDGLSGSAARYGCPDNTRLGSILVRLLPYLEEQSIYDRFDFNQPNVNNQKMPDGRLISSVIVSTYVCPSDNNGELLAGKACHNYAASQGPTRMKANGGCYCSLYNSLNNAYPAVTGAYESLPSTGPFFRRCGGTRLKEITDGLSKTIFFGEVRPACSEHIQRGWADSNNGNGHIVTLIPINYDSCDPLATNRCNRPCNWTTEIGYKSAHSGGAYFSFGDGSVHFLNDAVDMLTYQYLGNKADGNLIPGGTY